jgi:hypothetical protein
MPNFTPSLKPILEALGLQSSQISSLQNPHSGFCYVDNNAQETDLLGGSLPVIVNTDTWIEPTECNCNNITLDTVTGRLTYNGTEQAKLFVSAHISLTTTQGNNRLYTVYIYKNKAQTSYKSPASLVDSNDVAQINVFGNFGIVNPGDYFELYISNPQGINPVVLDLQVDIRSF